MSEIHAVSDGSDTASADTGSMVSTMHSARSQDSIRGRGRCRCFISPFSSLLFKVVFPGYTGKRESASHVTHPLTCFPADCELLHLHEMVAGLLYQQVYLSANTLLGALPQSL